MGDNMTKQEIHRKIEQYRVSDAPVHIKEAAIKALEAKLVPNDQEAHKQYVEGLSDVYDMQQD